MGLPRMGYALMPKKCHFCTFFEAEVPMSVGPVESFALMRTFCTVVPGTRRETPVLVSLNMVDDGCPF